MDVVTPTVGPSRGALALKRLVKALVAGALAVLATWLVGPGPGNVFGPTEAAFVVPVVGAVLLAIEKWLNYTPVPDPNQTV